MGHKIVNESINLKIYKTLLRPTVTYGCEHCTFTKRSKQMLLISERHVLTKIVDPVMDSYGRRIGFNYELQKLYKELSTGNYIKLQV